MELIRNRKWDNRNRIEEINKIIRKLSETGLVDVEYYRGRSFIQTQILGEGHPERLPEKGEWNQVVIHYKGRIALKLVERDWKIEGFLYNDNFEKAEYEEIKNGLASSGIYTWQDELRKHKTARFGYAFITIAGFIAAMWGIYTGDFMWTLVYSIHTIVFLYIFLNK